MDIRYIEEKIGFRFSNKNLLEQAFTRRSYAEENGGEDNEVLEFIGDKVLDLAVVKWLSDHYSYVGKDGIYYSDYDEDDLTDFKKQLVCRETLAARIDVLKLSEQLKMGKGDIKKKANRQASVKEDLFEAILGAAAIDTKWNMEKLAYLVENMLDPYGTLEGVKDFFKFLQEWNGKPLHIQYEFSALALCESYQSSDKYFCSFSLDLPDRRQKRFSGKGATKDIALNDACRNAYRFLDENGLLSTISDEIDEPSEEMAINQLEILAQRGYFSHPEYEFCDDEEYDEDGNRVWTCECYIEEAEYYFDASASSKKAAKKKAAFEMLKYVLENF